MDAIVAMYQGIQYSFAHCRHGIIALVNAFTICFALDPSQRLSYIREDVDVEADFMVIDGDYQLFDDIRLLHLPGHTDGLQGLMLSLKDGNVIFTSDAINTSQAFGPPSMPPAKAPWDSRAWRDSVERVRRLALENKASIIFGHDEEQYFTMRKAPEYYE